MVHFGDHVIISDDVSVLIHHKSGAGLFLAKRPLGKVAGWSAAEKVPEQVHAIVARIRCLLVTALMRIFGGYLLREVGGDVHYGRFEFLRQFGELISELHRVRDHQRRCIGCDVLTSTVGAHSCVDQSADHNPDGERNQQETQRQQFLLSHDLEPPHRKPFAFLIDPDLYI